MALCYAGEEIAWLIVQLVPCLCSAEGVGLASKAQDAICHSPLPCHVYRSSSRGRQLTLGRGWSSTSRKSCSRRRTPRQGSRELELEDDMSSTGFEC